LVDRTDGSDAHGAGGELPEVGHQPGMRVAAEPPCPGFRAAQLLPIMRQILFTQAALEKGTRIDPGCAVRLKEDKITAETAGPGVTRPEKVVEADFEELGGTGETGDMPAQFAIGG